MRGDGGGRPLGSREPGSAPSRVTELLESHPGEWFTPRGLHAEYEARWGSVAYETVRRAMYRVLDAPTFGKVYVRRLPSLGSGGAQWSTEVLWEYQQEGATTA